MRWRNPAKMASKAMAPTQARHTQKTTPRPARLALATMAGSATPRSSSYSRTRSMAPTPGAASISGTTDPGVEEAEQDVDAEVDDDVGDGGHQGHALDDEVVARIDGGDELEADAGELEEDLDHEG